MGVRRGTGRMPRLSPLRVEIGHSTYTSIWCAARPRIHRRSVNSRVWRTYGSQPGSGLATRTLGPGLEDGFDIEADKSLGMRMVQSLVYQMRRQMVPRLSAQGVHFVISMPTQAANPA